MTTETRTAAQWIAALEAARQDFLGAVEGIPDAELTKPVNGSWCIKDQVAHVSSWDELGATDLERASRGHMPVLATFKDEEIDDWNAGLMRGRTVFTAPQAFFELNDRRSRLITALEAAPEALVSGPLTARLCDVIIEHDEQHAKEIREWRQAEGV